MTYDIKFVGNTYTNSSSRDGYTPSLIVDHISSGSWSSLLSWFTSSGNKVSSSNYGVSKQGEIACFVPIDRMAWANGIKAEDIAKHNTPIVKANKGINPNKYSVSIEHEGTDGNLTEAQFQATVWLHRYIQAEIKRQWNYQMKLDKYDVIGHFQVDPVRKPLCPGKLFPWDKLYEELGRKDEVKLGLELTNSQWNLAKDTIQGLYDKHLITDKSWITKVELRTLTISELSWLNLIVLARK